MPSMVQPNQPEQQGDFLIAKKIEVPLEKEKKDEEE